MRLPWRQALSSGTAWQIHRIAVHESSRTTQPYDPTSDGVTLDEIERIRI